MIALTRVDEPVASPPLAPLAPPIDAAHLSRMTLGDRSLEREVLALFDRQADMLLLRMRKATPTVAAAAAHTLKGSARGVGAWRVASAAEAVELAASSQAVGEFKTAVAALSSAVDETKAAICEILRAH